MNIYDLSGIGDRERIAISGITLEILDQFLFMNPDRIPNPPSDARFVAAEKWTGLQVIAERPHNRRIKPCFQDAIGPGFTLPGCQLAVSEHAREVLAPILGDQACFLPIDVVGAPIKYWAFYATRYFYGELDEEISVFKSPYTSALDRRKMLRAAAFRSTENLSDLYIFRLPSTLDYIAPDITYATQKFFDLVKMHNLGGFNFFKIHFKGFKADPSEGSVLVSSGAEYFPDWN